VGHAYHSFHLCRFYCDGFLGLLDRDSYTLRNIEMEFFDSKSSSLHRSGSQSQQAHLLNLSFRFLWISSLECGSPSSIHPKAFPFGAVYDALDRFSDSSFQSNALSASQFVYLALLAFSEGMWSGSLCLWFRNGPLFWIDCVAYCS